MAKEAKNKTSIPEETSETSFFDIMKQDVGFDITPSNVDLEDGKRFTKIKVTSEQRRHLSAVLQQAPAVVAEGMMAQAYLVTFPEGLPHVLTTLKQGGYSTVLREHGKIVGSASLYSAATQAAVLGAFTAMSIVSGQYFLAQINSQLGAIQKKLDNVLQFLYSDKKAGLISEIKFAQFAYENYSAIMDNEQERIAVIINLQAGKKEAIRDIEFYIGELSQKANDKRDLEETRKSCFEMKECLDLAIQLYVMTTVLEVYYSQNQNQDYLDYLEQDVTKYIKKSTSRVLTSFSMLKGRIDQKVKLPLGKGDKTDAEIEELLEKLNQGEESELLKSLHSALNISEQPTEYYLSGQGEVYIKAQ